MDWARDLPGWPRCETSRRVISRPHRWHVQEQGDGPLMLLLHGAGASTHSWRDLVPLLAGDWRTVAIDLPGQGFTQAGNRSRLGLEGMTEDIARLCQSEGWSPSVIVGHSAGAAIALSLSQLLTDPEGKPARIVGLNAALGRFEGIAGWLFPLLARVLAANPLTAYVFTLGGDPTTRARRLIKGTGSHLSSDGIALYARLIRDRAHVDGTLAMMSRWDVDPLLATLDKIEAACLFITGASDKAVPPEVSLNAAGRIPGAEVMNLPDLGHLAHEEDPESVAALIRTWLAGG
ncbi:MAG: alpha/beta fold hydrolase BchO [Pseudooceanicola nanhaiensis]